MEHCKNQRGLRLPGQTENKMMAGQLDAHAGVKVISLTKYPLTQGKISRDFLKLRNISLALLFAPLSIRVACNLSNICDRASRKGVGP